jgi:hypothetical protein
MKEFDRIFADCKDGEEDFDVIFDQEDSLIDSVVGVKENGEPLTGSDSNPADTAEERESSDDNPDYEKELDAQDSDDLPKDAEGTVKEDGTDTELSGAEKCPAETAEKRSEDDENVDYTKELDAQDSDDLPKDVEGTVDYEFETEPEIEKKDDNTEPNIDNVADAGSCANCQKEEADVTDDEELGDAPVTDPEVAAPSKECKECGGAGCPACTSNEETDDVDYTADFDNDEDDNEVEGGELQEDPLNESDEIDDEVLSVADPEDDLEDQIIEDEEKMETGKEKAVEYDFEDEEIIDKVVEDK